MLTNNEENIVPVLNNFTYVCLYTPLLHSKHFKATKFRTYAGPCWIMQGKLNEIWD